MFFSFAWFGMLYMSALSPSQMNQTALGWGVPSADTVVSHTMRSVLSILSATLPNGVLVSMKVLIAAVT